MTNDYLTKEQEKRFKKLFNLRSNTVDEDGILLQKVLDTDPNQLDEELQMTFNDFKQLLYVPDIKSVSSSLKRLKEGIIKGRKYHYVHGWGKNGKTTFIRRFIKENNDSFEHLLIDFKDFQINRTEKRHSLATKTVEFFYVLLSIFNNELIDAMIDVLVHIETTQLKIIQNSFANESRKNYNSLFSSFRKELLEFIEEIIDEEKIISDSFGNSKQRQVKLFNDKFETFVDELIERKQLKPIELFNFLLLISIKFYGRENKKLIIYFDNIDDILTHSSEYLTAQIFPQVYDFIKILNSYLNINKTLVNNSILDEISFVFVYRTANYISSIYYLNHNPSSNERRQELINAPVYLISAVKATNLILNKKLSYYELLCDAFYIKKAKHFNMLKEIIISYYNENSDFTHLFKLWNGNHHAFSKVFASLTFSDIDFVTFSNSKISFNLKRGIFIYYLTKSYIKDSKKQINTFSTLSSVFQYTFTSELCEISNCRCNLLRMFLSYIINHNKKFRTPKAHVDKNIDILNKGVGFKEVMDALTEFKLNDIIVYDKPMFNELFRRIFHDDIDVFDYLIISYKNTDIENHEKRFGKKYDFSSEINLYFKHINDKDNKELEKLNTIKLYYNSNSNYLLNTIKKHFEFISSSLDGISCPLSQNIKIFKSKNEELINNSGYIFEYSLNKDILLEKVFMRMEHTLESITEFYLNSIYDIYPPQNYCDDSLFALNETFHYDSTISKHITYIEKVRQDLLKNNLNIELQENDTYDYNETEFVKLKSKIQSDVNGRFLFWINSYIELFYKLYNRIEKKAKSDGYKMDLHSSHTKNSFKTLQYKINEIRKTYYKDLTTKIETEW